MLLRYWLGRLAAASITSMLCLQSAISGTMVAYPAVIKSNYFSSNNSFLAEQPKYLVGGKGDDGYISITAEIDMDDKSCVSTGKSGGLFSIGAEKMQVVVSMEIAGFNGNLEEQDVPIATFDGRNAPGGCAVLSTVPMTVVSYSRMELFSSDNPGEQRILVNVRSTTEKDVNIVGAAQVLLTGAAIFATGGAATTVAGLTATLAKPALGTIQTQVNTALSKVVPGQAKISTNWPTIRRGLAPIRIPVYMGETYYNESSMQESIERMQSTTGAKPLFIITLRFTYSRSIYDVTLVDANKAPSIGSLSSENVLNHPPAVGIPNIFQSLNKTVPSPQSEIADKISRNMSIQSECGAALSTLNNNLRLTVEDRTAALKRFVDASQKTGNWYGNKLLRDSCFEQHPNEGAIVAQLFPPNIVQIEASDVMNSYDPNHATWKTTVAPVLRRLRDVLLVPDAAKAKAILENNLQKDIQLSVYPSRDTWAIITPDPSSTSTSPNIQLLAARKITSAGCFVTGGASNLKSGSFVLIDEGGGVWIATIGLGDPALAPFASVNLFRLNSDWANYLQTIDMPVGDCKQKILPLVKV